MWDDLVWALFTTFVQGAYVPSRQSCGARAPLLRFVPPLGSGITWIGRALDYVSVRGRGVGPIPPFNVQALRHSDSLALLLHLRVGNRLVSQIAAELADDSGRHTPLTNTAGVQPRTDDLLTQFAHWWSGEPQPLTFPRDQLRNAIHALKQVRPRLFLETFAHRPPEYAAFDVEAAIDEALDNLDPLQAVDDLFIVRTYRALFNVSQLPRLMGSNRLPAQTHAFDNLSELEQRLVELFDRIPPRIPSPLNRSAADPNGRRGADPNGRLMLYLSYFGRLNAILIAEILERPAWEVVRVLGNLWRDVLVAI